MIHIIKASGEKELFDYDKYKRSLLNADISTDDIKKLYTEIKPLLYDGMPAEELYTLTFERLKKLKPVCASKYSLKQALRLLGPTGFPFEQLVSLLLQKMGYTTQVDQTIEGKCVGHEIDILAEKNNQYTLVECKFHNNPKTKSDVKTVLYMKARFDDLAHIDNPIAACLIVSNTRFTSEAIAYAECTGVKLLAWGYPKENSLEQLINKYRLYPTTALLALTKAERKALLKSNIILCNQLLTVSHVDGIAPSRLAQLKQECTSLCH